MKIKPFLFLLFILINTNLYALSLDIITNSTTEYTIVYNNGNTTAKNNATEFQTAIKNKTGVSIPIKTDSDAKSEYEILLGPTNTRSEVTTENRWLSEFGFRINIAGKKIVITASDNSHMVLALKRFEDIVLRNDTYAGNGFLQFDENLVQTAEFSQTQATLYNIANGIDHETLTTTVVHTLAKDGSYDNAQGICSDGTYIYYVMKSSETSAKIYKVRMSDWTLVKKSSSSFNGGHCNDMCYDHINQRILCLAWSTNNSSSTIKTYNIINPETLAVTKSTVDLPHKAVEIDYNKETGHFVTICGDDIRILDSDRTTILQSITRTRPSGWTEQGMGADSQYFYSPLNRNGQSYIQLVTSSWATGEQKDNIKVNMSAEPESMIEVNGNYYINSYTGSGSKLYKINITLKYKAATF